MGKRYVIKGMSLRELSFVDKPAQPGAVATLIKRYSKEEQVAKELVDLNIDYMEATAEAERRQKLDEAETRLWQKFSALREVLRNIIATEMEGKDEKIANAIKEFGSDVQNVIPDITSAITKMKKKLEEDPMRKNLKDLKKQVDEAITKAMAGEDPSVDNIIKSVTPVLESLNEELEGLSTKVDELEKSLKKPADDESHVLADGSIIQKSVMGAAYDTLVTMDKQLRKQAEEVALEKAATDADAQYKNLPGTRLEKGAALSYIRRMKEDDTARTTLEKMLAAGQKAMEDLGKSVGTSANAGESPEKKEETDSQKATREYLEKTYKK